MHASPSPRDPSPRSSLFLRRSLRTTAAAAVIATGALAVGSWQLSPAAFAQLKSDAATVQTPMGRAPLSFADIVEKVKPAVVSISVTNGEAKLARNQKGRPDNPPGLPDLPDDRATPGPEGALVLIDVDSQTAAILAHAAASATLSIIWR